MAAFGTLGDIDTRNLLQVAYVVAVTSHPLIIATAVTGRWTATRRQNPELRRILDLLWGRVTSGHCPCLYLNEIADERGNSPTPAELHGVIEEMRKYCRDDNRPFAVRIDRWRKLHQTSEQQAIVGFRKYLYTSSVNRPLHLSTKRVARLLAFCDKLTTRLQAVPASRRSEPPDVPLVEIGYSQNVEPHLRQHRDHSSSNYIMNLFEATLGLLYPQKFQLHQYVIHCCVDVRHVGPAELLFNRLGEAYIGNAGGFGHYPAGISVSSAYDYTMTYWEDAAKWSLKHMEVEATHKVEMDRRAARQQEKQKLIQEIEELEREKTEALANPIPKLHEQFPGGLPPEVLALDEDGLIAYIAEIERQLEGRTDDDVHSEEAIDFYKAEQLGKLMDRWLEAMGTTNQYNVKDAR